MSESETGQVTRTWPVCYNGPEKRRQGAAPHSQLFCASTCAVPWFSPFRPQFLPGFMLLRLVPILTLPFVEPETAPVDAFCIADGALVSLRVLPVPPTPPVFDWSMLASDLAV